MASPTLLTLQDPILLLFRSPLLACMILVASPGHCQLGEGGYAGIYYDPQAAPLRRSPEQVLTVVATRREHLSAHSPLAHTNHVATEQAEGGDPGRRLRRCDVRPCLSHSRVRTQRHPSIFHMSLAHSFCAAGGCNMRTQ